MINEFLKMYDAHCLYSSGVPIRIDVSPDFKRELLRVAAEQSHHQRNEHTRNMFIGLPVKVVDDLDVPYEFVFSAKPMGVVR